MNGVSSTSRKRWPVVALVLIVIGAGAFFISRQGDRPSVPSPATGAAPGAPRSAVPNGEADDALAVSTVTVGRRSLTRSVTINAQVAPSREVAVAPKLSGTVAAVAVDVGDPVEEGQVLLQLEDETLTAQLRQADSALELAEANLARLEAGATEEEREQVAAALRQASLNLDQAKRQLERMEQLFAEGAISREQLDAARTGYEISQAQYDSAEQQMLRVERGATPEELRAARAQVSQARAARDLAQIQLDYARVTAPIAGIVSRRDVEVGGLVQAGFPALVLVDIDRVYVRGSVSQGYVHQVRAGGPVTVEIPSLGEEFPGAVHTVSPAADSAGLFPIRVEVENPDHRLKPGMFAVIRIPVEHADDALAVPVQALVRHGDGRAVYVVESEPSAERGPASGAPAHAGAGGRGIARLRPLRTGIEDGEWVQVLAGVSEGERVVVAGHAFLSDGRPVLWTPEE